MLPLFREGNVRMHSTIQNSVVEAIAAVHQLQTASSLAFLENASQCIAETFRAGGKLIIAGNGGSLCDAAHFAEELTGQFRRRRKALPAIALTEPGHITCVGNDFGFEEVFARGVEAFGRAGDCFVGLSTSGNSPNIVRAFEVARQRGLKTLSFLGREGGCLKGIADLELIISGFPHSDRVQEAHMAAIHILIERVEQLLFAPSPVEAIAARVGSK